MNYLGDWGLQFGEYVKPVVPLACWDLTAPQRWTMSAVSGCRLTGSWFWPIWLSGETKRESLAALVWGELMLNLLWLEKLRMYSQKSFRKVQIIVFLLQVYVQVNQEAERNEHMKQAARDFFRQLEQRDGQAVSLWKQFREITVDEYQRVYKVPPAHNSEAHRLIMYQNVLNFNSDPPLTCFSD